MEIEETKSYRQTSKKAFVIIQVRDDFKSLSQFG